MLDLILLIISVISTLFLGQIIFLKDKKSFLHQSFFIFTLSAAAWSIANYISLNIENTNIILFCIRLTMFFAVLQSISFFFFIHTFPNRSLLLKKSFFYSILLFSFVTSVACITPLVFSGIEIVNGEISPTPGIGMILFIPNSIGFILAGVVILIKKIRVFSGIPKMQLNYIFFGFILMFVTLVFFNFILVNIFHNSTFVSFGSLFILPFIFFTTIAMIRYKFMNTRLIIVRSVIYLLLVFSVSAVGTVTTIYLGEYLSETYGISKFLTVIVSSLLIVIFIDPTKKIFTRLTERIFYKTRINYQSVLAETSEILNQEIDLPKLIDRYTEALQDKMKIADVYLWLPVDEDIFMRAQTHHDKKESFEDIPVLKEQSLIEEMKKKKTPIIREEYEYILNDIEKKSQQENIQAIIEALHVMKAAILIPVFNQGKLAGILALNDKLSGEAYAKEDIALFDVIAPQLGASLEKARLYEDVKEFNVKLEHEIKKATTDLREANTKLTQLDQAKSEFMSIASHQLRTPLAGISGYLSMMMDGDYGEINPEQKPVVRDILNASQRLARIVNVFLNVTRIEAGRFVMNFSKAPFFSVIEDIYKELKPTAEKKGVQLTLEPAELPEVEADIDKMKDVILNLIDNAIKYSPEGSVHVTAKANKRTIHVQVKDTGVGIEPNEAKNLFSKFVRGSGIAQVQPDGSGLGLYIAKRVIEGHGGKIWVESEGAGKGSVFHFEIPIVADPESVKKTEEFQQRAKKE